jgi:glycosyltransferase involved in cell wall biosynthesis
MAVLEQRIPKWLIYAGALNDKEKSAHLAGSDAVLVLSQYEAFGFVALEAIVHEVTPVLWSDLPAAAVLVGKGAVTVPRTGGATSAARAVLQAVNSRPEAALVRSWSEYVQDVRLQIESVLVRG